MVSVFVLTLFSILRANRTAGMNRTRLEMLNLSQNRLDGVKGLGSLPALIALNLGTHARSLFLFFEATNLSRWRRYCGAFTITMPFDLHSVGLRPLIKTGD